jgi:thymidine phosphorylase
VSAGEPLAEVHARDDASAERGVAAVSEAYSIGDGSPEAKSVILDVIR